LPAEKTKKGPKEKGEKKREEGKISVQDWLSKMFDDSNGVFFYY